MSAIRFLVRVTILVTMVLTVVGEKPVLAATQDTKGTTMGEPNPQLDWVPSGKPEWHTGWMNGYARGLDLILNQQGSKADYVTIMGDIGLAFIVQGEENSVNRIDGAVDVGWWPLEPLGMIRLDFLEKTVGREIQDIKLPSGGGKQDPIATYKEWFEPAVVSSLEQGRPALMRVGTAWYVVTGYDDGESPLIGMCSNTEGGDEKVDRVVEPMPPYAGFALGKTVPGIDRKAADLEALKFAVALHHDRVLGTNGQYAGKYPLRRAEEFGKYWRTGVKSLGSWIECLQDMEHTGRWYWHNNVVQHLRWNRTTAVRYLKEMKGRHSETVETHLGSAIQKYQAVLREISRMDVSDDAISSVEGRHRLITNIVEITRLESEAVESLEKAVKAFS